MCHIWTKAFIFVTPSNKMSHSDLCLYHIHLSYNPCKDLLLTYLLMQLIHVMLTPNTNPNLQELKLFSL